MEFKEYCRLLWKRRGLATVTFCTCLAVAGAAASTVRPTFLSTSKLLVEQHDKKTASMLGQELAGWSELSSVSKVGGPLETQAELLRCAPLIERVVRHASLFDTDTGLWMTPTEFLRHSNVSNPRGTDILELSFKDADPAMAKLVTDTWSQAFVDDNRAINQRESANALNFLARQLAESRSRLATAEGQLRDFKAANRSLSPTEQARNTALTVGGLEQELRTTAAAEQESQARLAALRAKVGMSSGRALTASALSEDPGVQRLREQLLEAETDPVLLGGQATRENPDVALRQHRVDALRRRLGSEAQAVLGKRLGSYGTAAPLDPLRQALTRDLVQAEVTTLGTQSRLKALKALLGSVNHDLKALPAQELRLLRLERQAQVEEERFRDLQRRYDQARLQKSLGIANIRVIEEGTLPDRPLMPKSALMWLAGSLAGLLLGIGVPLLREYFDETIKSPEEAGTLLGLPALGVIPRQLGAPGAPPRTPGPALGEAYRSLRTSLRFATAGPDMRTLVVASARGREGRTSTVVNLAKSWAAAGKKVLLVDADWMNPQLHVRLGMPNRRGLAGLVAEGGDLDRVIAATDFANLDLLSAGTARAPALLETEAFSDLLAACRARYDLVLVDVPPVLESSDALVVASQVDGVLFSLCLHRTPAADAARALDKLRLAAARLVGTVAWDPTLRLKERTEPRTSTSLVPTTRQIAPRSAT